MGRLTGTTGRLTVFTGRLGERAASADVQQRLPHLESKSPMPEFRRHGAF